MLTGYLCKVSHLILTAEVLKYKYWWYFCCCCPVARSCLTHCYSMDCSMPCLSVPHHLPKFAQVHVHCVGLPSSHLIQWCPLLTLTSFFPSTRDFSSESAVHIRWPKYRNFNFSISSSNECSGLISLKIDWFDLFAVQGTLTSLLSTIVQRHQFSQLQKQAQRSQISVLRLHR